jgi:hypothetical protein
MIMTRRIILAILLVLCATPSAWAKFKEDEQKYLDDQFKLVLDQMQALGNTVAALNTQLAEYKQNQAQLQTAIMRQQHQLQDLDEMLSSLRIGNEENFSKLKAAIADLRAQTESLASKLAGGQPGAPTGSPVETPAVTHPGTPPVQKVVQGYITNVEGTDVTIDMGSAKGMTQGARLAVYKATDTNTRVGVVEVTQVIDNDNSRARIVTMNPGVKPEFSDIVRVE